MNPNMTSIINTSTPTAMGTHLTTDKAYKMESVSVHEHVRTNSGGADAVAVAVALTDGRRQETITMSKYVNDAEMQWKKPGMAAAQQGFHNNKEKQSLWSQNNNHNNMSSAFSSYTSDKFSYKHVMSPRLPPSVSHSYSSVVNCTGLVGGMSNNLSQQTQDGVCATKEATPHSQSHYNKQQQHMITPPVSPPSFMGNSDKPHLPPMTLSSYGSGSTPLPASRQSRARSESLSSLSVLKSTSIDYNMSSTTPSSSPLTPGESLHNSKRSVSF
jgi:hypothetical protein